MSKTSELEYFQMKKSISKYLIAVLALAVAVVLFKGFWKNRKCRVISGISNADINWSFGSSGVFVKNIDGETGKIVQSSLCRDWIFDELLNTLNDPDRFAAAHVALVYLSDHPVTDGLGFKDDGTVQWYYMVIDSQNDPSQSDRKKLIKMWMDYRKRKASNISFNKF